MLWIYNRMMHYGYSWEDFNVIRALCKEVCDLGIPYWDVIEELENLVKSLPKVA